jgi:hypothetical protein
MLKRGSRPGRGAIDEAAHSAWPSGTARRSPPRPGSTQPPPKDAEDAYQRGLEILLTKAPTTREEELVPWLKTVVLRTFVPSSGDRG